MNGRSRSSPSPTTSQEDGGTSRQTPARSSSGSETGRPARTDREGLRFDLVDHDDRHDPARTWRETETPLEKQATDIVCGILLRVEQDARKGALWSPDFRIKERAKKAREAKLAAERAEADRVAREKAQGRPGSSP